jgi:DNA-binding MarR family transcriptional regulator
MIDVDEIFTALQYFTSRKGKCNLELATELGSDELTAKQFYYLEQIDCRGDLTFSSLAERLCITKPSVTEIINKLIKLDCIYKEKSPTDGRVYYIYLTAKGKKIARMKSETNMKLARQIRERLNPEEQELFINLLRKIAGNCCLDNK